MCVPDSTPATLLSANRPLQLLRPGPPEALIVYVHAFERSDFRDDEHPTCFLHWAGLLPKRARDYAVMRNQGENFAKLKVMASLVRRAAARKNRLRLPYQQHRLVYADAYERWIGNEGRAFDLVVCCPSSRDDARFYWRRLAASVLRNRNDFLDLSDCFLKERGFKMGSAGSLEQARAKIACNFDGALAGIRDVLLVDDVWASGKTVGLLVSLLAAKGLPEEAQVTVFAPIII